MKRLLSIALAFAMYESWARQPTDEERRDSDNAPICRVPSAMKPCFRLGVAGQTFVKKTTDEVLRAMKIADLRFLCLKDSHFSYDSSEVEIVSFKRKCLDFGVECAVGGPLYFKDEAGARRLFSFAKRYDMKTVVGVPYAVKEGAVDVFGPNRIECDELIGIVERLVREYDIRFAIHNHGPDMPDLFPDSEAIWRRIKDRDRRIGFCLDVGHERRSGKDPIVTIHRFADRIYDIHLKNIRVDPQINYAFPAPRGELDIPNILQALEDVGYCGICHIEYERDFDDNLMGLVESVGYYRGCMDMLRHGSRKD